MKRTFSIYLTCWLVCPATLTTMLGQVASVTIGNGPAQPDGSYLNATDIAGTLAFTYVGVTSTNKIDIADNIDLANTALFGPTYFDLSLNTVTINLLHDILLGNGGLLLNAQTVNLNGKVTTTNGTLLSESSIAGTATNVNVLSAAASLQQAIDFASTTNLVTIQVSPGQYQGNLTIDKLATLRLTNGVTVLASNAIYLGFTSNSTSRRIVNSGSSLVVSNAAGTGVFDIRRGTNQFNSGLINVDQLVMTNTAGVFEFNGGVLKTRGTTSANGSPFVVGNGSFSASFELPGNSTHSFANGLQIASNALLSGDGTVIGNVTLANGGTLSPGASMGRLTVNGNLILTSGSTNVFELDKGSGTNDNITGLASVTLGGTLMVTNLSGTLTNGDTFKLFSAAAYGGAFSSFSATAPGPGLKWNLHRLPVDGVLQVLSATSAPPVIGSITLLDGTNLVISASEGTPYDPVYLLTATNVNLPMMDWVYLATNNFDVAGNVNLTNAIVTGEPEHYFRLQVQ